MQHESKESMWPKHNGAWGLFSSRRAKVERNIRYKIRDVKEEM